MRNFLAVLMLSWVRYLSRLAVYFLLCHLHKLWITLYLYRNKAYKSKLTTFLFIPLYISFYLLVLFTLLLSIFLNYAASFSGPKVFKSLCALYLQLATCNWLVARLFVAQHWICMLCIVVAQLSECQMSCKVAKLQRAHDSTHTSRHDFQKMRKTVESLHKLKLSRKSEVKRGTKLQKVDCTGINIANPVE